MILLKEKILKIRERPAMFLGKNYICCLKSYLDGILSVNIELIADLDYLKNFQSFIEEKYDNNSQSWDRILMQNSSDEYTALMLFFKEIEEYNEKVVK